jgi:hypothetical protein
MDGNRDHNIKRGKPGSESQIPHIFSHMQKLDLKGKMNMNINGGEAMGSGIGKREAEVREYMIEVYCACMKRS